MTRRQILVREVRPPDGAADTRPLRIAPQNLRWSRPDLDTGRGRALLHTMACKAAIKNAGYHDPAEFEDLGGKGHRQRWY